MPERASTESCRSAWAASIVEEEKVVRSTGLCPNLRTAIRSFVGFAATKARAAPAASASALPAIEREVSTARTTLFSRPRFSAWSPVTGMPSSLTRGGCESAPVVTTVTCIDG